MSKKNLKLNLGCGFDKRPGYINLDVDPRVKPDKVQDLLDPLHYRDSTVSEIVLQDVLEHFTKEDGEKLLRECVRVLEENGRLKIRVPNPQAIVDKFSTQDDLKMLYLYGDTSQNGVWGAHKYGYTPGLMRELGDLIGFAVDSAIREDTNWAFVVRKLVGRHDGRTGEVEKGKIGKLSRVTIQTIGLPNEWLNKELKKLGGEWVVLSNVWSQLFLTLPYSFVTDSNSKKIAWLVTTPLPSPIAKTVVRWLSKRVTRIGFQQKKLRHYVTNDLQYSHLRILDGSRSENDNRS